jgi:hypothetical protein
MPTPTIDQFVIDVIWKLSDGGAVGTFNSDVLEARGSNHDVNQLVGAAVGAGAGASGDNGEEPNRATTSAGAARKRKKSIALFG